MGWIEGPLRGVATAALTAMALGGGFTDARAQVPVAKPAPATAAALDTARLAFEALPLADRIDIQDGLVWTGDYSGALDGTFGRMTFESLTAFQTRHKFPADGILSAPARKALAEGAATKRTAVGFQAVADAATGVRIHLPMKLLGPPAKRDGGTRWVGRGGAIQIDTWAIADGDLAQIYERMRAETPGRKVVYAVLRPDWFVVSDEVGGRHGYARFARGPQGVRGFVFTLDAALGPDLDRVVMATAGRFEPFPGTTAAPAVAATTPATPTAPAATPAAPVATPAVAATSASGFIVAPGKVLTASAAVAGCRSLTVGGKPATVVTADAGGAAILAMTGGVGGPLRTGGVGNGPATVVASGETDGRAGVIATSGEMIDGRLNAALQRGGQGAAVFDASGGLIGLVGDRPDEARAIAGSIPPARYALVGGEALTAAIGAAGGTLEPATTTSTTTPATTGRIVAATAGRVTAIVCRR